MRGQGIIFDIQRFSLHDGPGIRTTVFLKGCSMRCRWCHNPESWSVDPQLMFYRDRCTDCLACVDACENHVHRSQQGVHTVQFSLCNSEGTCVDRCAYGALKICGKERNVREVLEEVMADGAYYQNSGGGLTVSGGEPMLQVSFVRELLAGAKERGLHTCMETSGYARTESYRQIREFVDLFLFDIKHTNDAKHTEYTGVSNKLILRNLEALYEGGAQILIRCPIIPGINDTDEHIGGIAELMRKYPGLEGPEILPYHDMGKSKWRQIGGSYRLSELKNLENEQKNLLLQRFRKAGCQSAKVSGFMLTDTEGGKR